MVGLLAMAIVAVACSSEPPGQDAANTGSPTPTELTPHAECMLEIGHWATRLADATASGNAQLNAVSQEAGYEFGYQSPKYDAIQELSIFAARRAFEVGAEQAYEEMVPRMDERCEKLVADGGYE